VAEEVRRWGRPFSWTAYLCDEHKRLREEYARNLPHDSLQRIRFVRLPEMKKPPTCQYLDCSNAATWAEEGYLEEP
jgi:hypothetical protein